MDLVWDDRKRAANLEKHGVDFAIAEDFAWSTAIVDEDGRRNYGERRFLAFGKIQERLHSLVFTRRANAVRIISLRKANSRERKKYEEAQRSGS